MIEKLDVVRRPLAVVTSAATLALIAAGCGGNSSTHKEQRTATAPVPARTAEKSFTTDRLIALIKHVPVGQDSYADGMLVGNYRTRPRHPNFSLWGVVQYCTKPGGEFIEINLDTIPLAGNPEPRIALAITSHPESKAACADGVITRSELLKPTQTAPTNTEAA